MSNALDVKAITKTFFAAYDAHDVDGMLALCAVCEVTTVGFGLLAILACAGLSSLRTPGPRLAVAPLAA